MKTREKQFSWVGAVVWGTLVLLTGCGSLGTDSGSGVAQVRFVQVSAGGPAVDFDVDSSGAAYGLSYQSFTSYLPLTPGTTHLSAVRSGLHQEVAGQDASLLGGHRYTLLLSQEGAGARETMVEDADAPAAAGRIRLRILNMVDTFPALTVYISPADGSGVAHVQTLQRDAAAGYLDLPASQDYTVSVSVRHGGLQRPVSSLTVKSAPGAVRTVVLSTSSPLEGTAAGVSVFLLKDANT